MLYSTSGEAFSSSPMPCTSDALMWRPSARGCTVMPGAPAAMHVDTAFNSSGSLPPRELRSVATLLTLTDSLIDRIDNLMGPQIDLLQVLPFEHHTHQRLRA